MTRPALLFDLYGVLLHTQSDGDIAAIEQACGTDGRLWPVYWELRPAFDAGELTADQYWSAVCSRLNLVEVDIDRVVAADTASWLRPDDEMIRAVCDLAGHGWTVGLLSNIPEFLAGAVRAEFDFLDRFDAVTMSFGLRNVAGSRVALRELLRVTRPGGRVVICEFSHPPCPLFAALYRFYNDHVLPVVAKAVSSNAAAYDYLNESIRQWPDQPTLAAWMRDAGWQDVAYRNLSFGIVALHRGFKAV